MTKYSTILAVLYCLVSITGCKPEEPLITSYDGKWRLLVSGSNGLYTISMPGGSGATNVWRPSTPTDPYPVTMVREYRDRLYVVLRTAEIAVLNRTDFTVVGSISLPSPAAGIAFANATTAYISVPLERAVLVTDLTVLSTVRSIDVGSAPADIACAGNQLCVLTPEKVECKIIDSRTNNVEATISLPTEAPIYVGADGLSGVFCVVMKGAGKDSVSGIPPTAPTLSSIDIVTRKITATVTLSARDSEAKNQIPRGIAINSNGFCYIPVQNGLLQAATRNPKRAAAVQFDQYHGAWYDGARATILCVQPDGRTITVFDEYAENIVGNTVLADSANWLLGMAP